MAEVNAVIVSSFEGIKQPGLTGRVSTRRQLDKPREMYNFHITRDGHLYMPKAAELVWNFTSMTGEDTNSVIMAIHYVETPRGLLVQSTSGRIYHISIEPPSSTAFPSTMIVTHIATMGTGEEQWTIWSNGIDSAHLFGYKPRGSAGPDTDGKTWKITGTWDAPVATEITSTGVTTASYSQLYKGRRWWVGRGRTLSYSPLNDLDAPAEGSFQPGGDDSGDSYLTNPGFVQGMTSWEGFLTIFFSGSVWILTGASIQNWQLRQAETSVGNVTSRTLVPTDEGIYTYGGANVNDRGLYVFTGNRAQKVSVEIDNWLALSPGNLKSATVSGGVFILSTGRNNVEHRQVLIHDMLTRQWTAFDGFILPAVYTQFSHVLASSGGVLYRNPSEIFPRMPGRGSRLMLGYADNDNPSGLIRFQALKIAGRRWGSSTPQARVIATTDTSSITSAWVDIPTDVFDSLVIPINLRGAAISLELQFTAPEDDNELLIENLQLLVSSKGEKVSRG